MKIADAIAYLGRKASLENLTLDKNGVCRLVFDQSLIIDCELLPGDDERAYFYSVLAPLPLSGRKELYEELLTANLFGRDSGDASFAVDLLPGEIIVQQKVDGRQMSEEDFVSTVDAFVSVVETWREKITAGSSAAASLPPLGGGENLLLRA